MMVFLLKNWKSLLDIILVIALVLLFFIWNPFGLFGGGLQLRPTANLVTEIKEMGQLITSEYYGEVIASMEEARMNYLEEEAIAEKANQLYDRLYEAMIYLRDFQKLPLEMREAEYEKMDLPAVRRRTIRSEVTRNNILDKLNSMDLLGDLSYEPLYADILEYVWTNDSGARSWRASSRQKEEALMLIYSRAEKNQEEDLQDPAFVRFYYSKRHAEQPKKEMRKKLAMVGRGWVKAGFDFSRLDNTNFYVNEEAGEVHFFGFSATILNSDINPWFIPEQGIPGFEILDYNGKVDFKDAQKLKLYCVDKLVATAHEADILGSAERNGAEILKSLFSLLSGKEIKKVYFHRDDIIQFSKTIAEDQYVSYHEAVLLDLYLTKERAKIDSLLQTKENSHKNNQLANHREENIRQISSTLYQLPFEDYPGPFNKLSRLAYEIARDSIIDPSEWAHIKAARVPFFAGDPQQKQFSLEDSLSHAAEYNMLLKYLYQKEVKSGIKTDSVITGVASTGFLSNQGILSYDRIDENTVRVNFLADTVPAKVSLSSLLYPYSFNEQYWNKIMSEKKLILDSLPISSLDTLTIPDSITLLYIGRPSPHLKSLHIPLDQFMEPILIAQHGDADSIWISPDLSIIRQATPTRPASQPVNTLLSTIQQVEMEEFYWKLVNTYADHKKIGPVFRANQWMQKKFEDNTGLSAWLSKLKTRLSE